MTETLHNMPDIPIDSILKVVDRRYLFTSVVIEIADTFNKPRDRLERMRLVREALLRSVTEMSVITEEVHQEQLTGGMNT